LVYLLTGGTFIDFIMANQLNGPHCEPEVRKFFGPNAPGPNERPNIPQLGFPGNVPGYVKAVMATLFVPPILHMSHAALNPVLDMSLYVVCLQGHHEFLNWFTVVWYHDPVTKGLLLLVMDTWIVPFFLMSRHHNPLLTMFIHGSLGMGQTFFTAEQERLASQILAEMAYDVPDERTIQQFRAFCFPLTPNVELFNFYLRKMYPHADASIDELQDDNSIVHRPPKTEFLFNWNQPLMGLAFKFTKGPRPALHVQTDPRYRCLGDGKIFGQVREYMVSKATYLLPPDCNLVQEF
jgi:hypothetical protein